MEYEILSHIVAVWLLKHNRFISESYKFSFAMEFSHAVVNTNMTRWNINCSLASYATFGYNWDLNGCYTRIINSTRTKCICVRPGTYAVLITSIPLTVSSLENFLIKKYYKRKKVYKQFELLIYKLRTWEKCLDLAI